jgi:FKBP-type peptidyl-prolyl cis-trans isomerase SlyD
MTISKSSVVSFHYRLSENGQEIESSFDGEPLLSLIGHGSMIPGLENALIGKNVGDRFSVDVAPEDAYGERVEKEPVRVPVKHLLGKYKKIVPGQLVVINTQNGARQATVVKAGKFNIDVDTNHPLAGKTLSFEIEILEARPATQDEISHGHAHGAGGHHH